MSSPTETNYKLRSVLNTSHAGRERLCIGILNLERDYSNVKPRRPEGGPDGSRDIESYRGNDLCFGAVSFVNNATDSSEEKRRIKSKYVEDIEAALIAESGLKAFVFFTNIDLTPGEVETFQELGKKRGLSFVDIYYRERIRIILDNPEGFALRYQYLSINLSEAEQATFFNRFGKDIERLVTGKFERLEEKLDSIQFSQWQTGKIRALELKVVFKSLEEYVRDEAEHFRICLEMQGVYHERRSILLGCEDHYLNRSGGKLGFDTKKFFYRQGHGEVQESWIPEDVRGGGGVVSGITIALKWRPASDVWVAEFEDLALHFHFTENLFERISRVQLTIDSYVFLDSELKDVHDGGPGIDWPRTLTAEEANLKWKCCECGHIWFGRLPKRVAI